jgi:hypothetical protein
MSSDSMRRIGAWQAEEEARRTLPDRLRARCAAGEQVALLTEAAECIEFLQRQVQRLNDTVREEQREAARSEREAYAEGRYDATIGDDMRGTY